jgi:hypothetical protein
MPSLTDILVVSGLLLFAAFPYLVKLIPSRPAKSVAPAAPVDDHAEWQTRWTNTLIKLLNELDESEDRRAVELTRDLMWQILGGSDAPQTKK